MQVFMLKNLHFGLPATDTTKGSRVKNVKLVPFGFLKYGMTPLMHAACKGRADMCRLLLQHGADVNCNQHEYGYTALMFAGLSGTVLKFKSAYENCDVSFR